MKPKKTTCCTHWYTFMYDRELRRVTWVSPMEHVSSEGRVDP